MYDWADGIAQLWSRCKVGATAQGSDLCPESLNGAPEGCSQPAEGHFLFSPTRPFEDA